MNFGSEMHSIVHSGFEHHGKCNALHDDEQTQTNTITHRQNMYAKSSRPRPIQNDNNNSLHKSICLENFRTE